MNDKGDIIEMDDQMTNSLLLTINTMANLGLRTICLAYRHLDRAYSWEDDYDTLEQSMVCYTIVGIEVLESVRDPSQRLVSLTCTALCIGVIFLGSSPS